MHDPPNLHDPHKLDKELSKQDIENGITKKQVYISEWEKYLVDTIIDLECIDCLYNLPFSPWFPYSNSCPKCGSDMV
jgi:hypothetical protein